METLTALKRYGKAVRRRWWLPVALAMIALAGAYIQFGGPRWVASSLLMPTVSPAGSPSPGTPGEPPQLQPLVTAVINDVVQLVGAQSLAERVARRVNMNVRDVQKSTWASIPKNTNLVLIQVMSPSPQVAADNANIVAEELIDYYKEINAHDAREARQFIEKQLAEVRAQLDAFDNALQLAKQDPLSQEGAPLALLNKYYGASTALDDAQRALRERDARLEATTAGLAKEQPTQVSEVDVQETPAYQRIQSSLADLEIQKTQLGKVFTPRYPPLQVLEEQIPALKTRLLAEPRMDVAREVKGINPVYAHLLQDVVSLRVDRAGAAAQIAALRSIIRDHQTSFASLAIAQSRVTRLVRESQILAANYSALAVRHRDAILREQSAQSFPAGLQVVQRAVPPLSPWAWFVWIAIAACVVGLVLGIAAAIGLEALDESVRTSEEVERTLGAVVLAEVPNARRPRRRLAWATVRPVIVLILALGIGSMAYRGPSFVTDRPLGQAEGRTATPPRPSPPGGAPITATVLVPVNAAQHPAEASLPPAPSRSLSEPPTVPSEVPPVPSIAPHHAPPTGAGATTASPVISTPPEPSGFHVQTGAFNNLAYAQELIQQLQARGYHAGLAEIVTNPPPHRVWVGEALDHSSAVHLVAQLKAHGFDAILISPRGANEGGTAHVVSSR